MTECFEGGKNWPCSCYQFWGKPEFFSRNEDMKTEMVIKTRVLFQSVHCFWFFKIECQLPSHWGFCLNNGQWDLDWNREFSLGGKKLKPFFVSAFWSKQIFAGLPWRLPTRDRGPGGQCQTWQRRRCRFGEKHSPFSNFGVCFLHPKIANYIPFFFFNSMDLVHKQQR